MFISDPSGLTGVPLDVFPLDPGPYLSAATQSGQHQINQINPNHLPVGEDLFNYQILEERPRLELRQNLEEDNAPPLGWRWRFRVQQAINKLLVRLGLKKASEQELLQPLLSSREP